ncbi:Alpha/Beta hydrolase protein [Gamsiella multidivaricata]|uniref:Alpha/Beta hydrolase protein n=1 Tax=Gamsiella multidivaricata TaxID=101098 RepID=UPI0022200C98|nr:Alpha/Beta hydrolase protein [Gamsiella multidivaricata]KAG0363019.1 hypothetical protein BGZ54_008382 [Gamsiella multidivaricata]KAI7824429.1 Alpha/Beta hydrolase protein [Gamsiella multidivaricata]
MDMETVSQILMGSHPTWAFLNSTNTGSRLLLQHQEQPLITALIVLVPLVSVWLFRRYTISPVVITHNDKPVSIQVYDKGTGKSSSESLIDYIARTCPSLMDPKKAVFKPTLWMTSGHIQTAYAAYMDFASRYVIDYQRELMKTPDGGTVSIDWFPSFENKPVDDTPTLVLLHGLTGGSFESYIRALVETMTKDHGYRCVVFNARACANTELTSAQLYCGSWTDDLRMVVKHIRKTLPEAKLMSVGFSLGSNILMNYMGEEGDQCEFLGAMSVGNPYDLMGTCYAMERGFLQKLIYSPTMGGNLKRIFFKHAKLFENHPEIDLKQVEAAHSIRMFDDAVTRRIFKYRTVHEYYRMASCSQRILDIKRPFLCLTALDDPVAVEECCPYDEIKGNPYGILATTSHGGHLGWFQGFLTQERWCTRPLAEFCIAMFEADRRPVSQTPTKPAVGTQEQEDTNSSHMVRDMNGTDRGATTKPHRDLNNA